MSSPTLLDRQPGTDNFSDPRIQAELTTARKQIKDAFQWTLFLGGVNSLFFLAALTGAKTPGGPWLIVDVIFIFGMSYGIFRNSKVCAKLMFGYFLLNKILQVFDGRFPIAAIFLSCVALYYLWMGIIGTTSYHRLMEEKSMSSFVAMSSDMYQQQSTSSDRSPEPIKAKAEPLNPSAALLAACGGDRAQAQWLLSEVKIKHLGQSVDWCNQKAVQQLTGENIPPVEG